MSISLIQLTFCILLTVALVVLIFSGCQGRTAKISASICFAGVICLSYGLGWRSGAEVYAAQVSGQLVPILKGMIDVSPAVQRATVRDFLVDSSSIKNDSSDFIREMKQMREALSSRPNQSLQPTSFSVTPRAGARVAPEKAVAEH